MDQAFVLSLLEMYVNGVSTRNVTNIVKKLTGDDISKSLVSSLTPKLDEQVRAFKNRKLDHSRFDYVYADAMYIKVRENDSVVSKGVYIALGVNEDHKREVLGFDILGQESTQNWTNFFQDLKARGLQKPKLIISDAHEGLKTAIKEQFIGTTWQRCVAHFIRNIIKKMPRKNSGDNNLMISRIFNATNQDEARARKREFEELVGDDKRYEAALEILDNGFEDAIPYLLEHEAYQVSLKTTNTLERFNRELRRRDRTIGIYPNSQSAQRLMGALLLDQHEEWLEMKRAFLKIPSLSYQHLQV